MSRILTMNKKYIEKLREANTKTQIKFKESAHRLTVAEKALAKAKLENLNLLGDLNSIGLTLRNLGASEV